MTENLYVLGHPVAHSKSPVMHNALYAHLGLDWHYDLIDCATEEEAVAFLERGAFLGANITMPYKPHALRASSDPHASAVLAQGANVVVHGANGLCCYNMDGAGAVRYLEMEGTSFDGAQVAVCGTGPTSLAIAHAAAVAGAASVCLMGRDAKRAQQRLDGYLERLANTADAGLAETVSFNACSYEQAAEGAHADFSCAGILERSDIVVDATPLGMNASDPTPFNTDALQEGQWVLDVVYGHGVTALAAAAQKAGSRFRDGSGMLVSQAVLGAKVFLEAGGAQTPLDFNEAFRIMAEAAGFQFDWDA